MNIHDNQQLIIGNNMPGVDAYQDTNNNPTLKSPFSPYELPFKQTRESLLDVEEYKRFLDNIVLRFRRTRFYNNYKGFLLGLGLDRCQIHGNITSEMATLEMHHNVLTVFDMALIITEHLLATTGYVTTFDVISLLKKEHREHNTQLVMLSKTPHQLYHNAEGIYLHPDQCIGDWFTFLQNYKYGLTIDVAYKILYYINDAINSGRSYDNQLLDIRDHIIDWSEFNGNNNY